MPFSGPRRRSRFGTLQCTGKVVLQVLRHGDTSKLPEPVTSDLCEGVHPVATEGASDGRSSGAGYAPGGRTGRSTSSTVARAGDPKPLP
ncbi:hypothetical protein GCM10019016_102950 [Streptomyces prasinosporus]|uniref:Uncharacterized protein n=1 Tax=Streptomyces prasinosporus TaxID=68256 RepID=A0ABP6U676_9ACTN